MVKVQGIGGGLAALPRTRSSGPFTEITDSVALTGNAAQDAAAISAKEDAVLNNFAPPPEDTESRATADVGAQQSCEKGQIGDRRSSSARAKDDEPAFGGVANGPIVRTTVRYKRIACNVWQITNVLTTRIQGTWEVRLDTADYTQARFPGERTFSRMRHPYRCQLLRLGETIDWDARDNWEIVTRNWFTQGLQIRSADSVLVTDTCDPRGVHMKQAFTLRGPNR